MSSRFEGIPFPIKEGEERLKLNTEQTENAEQGIIPEPADDSHIEKGPKAVMDSYLGHVDKLVAAMIQTLTREGQRAENVNVWESLREQLANSAKQKMMAIISETKRTNHTAFLLGKVAETIDQDIFKGPRQASKIPEAIDRGPEETIVSFIRSKGNLTEQDVEDVEKAFRLASLNGEYKFFKWQHRSQLEQILLAQEELTKTTAGFAPGRAGFFDTRMAVENGMAALRLDLDSKPNYRYAYPEYRLRSNDCEAMLDIMSKVEAMQLKKISL